MVQGRPQPSKRNKAMGPSDSGLPKVQRHPRSAPERAPRAANPSRSPSPKPSEPSQPTENDLSSMMNLPTLPAAQPTEFSSRGKRPSARPLAEKADPNPHRPKRRRLPSLQEVLDAFDPMDEYLAPEPEPGDFWIEPDR
jgi:hypothetical protein